MDLQTPAPDSKPDFARFAIKSLDYRKTSLKDHHASIRPALTPLYAFLPTKKAALCLAKPCRVLVRLYKAWSGLVRLCNTKIYNICKPKTK